MHGKRNYTKGTNEYWSGIILKQRAAKKVKISQEMSLVAAKYSENDPDASIDDLSVTQIREELKKKTGVKTRLKKRKTFRPFKSKRQRLCCYFLCIGSQK